MRYATIRVSAQFAHWLKIESARRGVTMYAFLESLAENGLGGATPWEDMFVPTRKPSSAKPSSVRGRHKRR